MRSVNAVFRVAACAAGLAIGTPALAQEIRVTGCPVRGVEGGCILIKAPDGTTYNVTSADPKPDLAQRLAISVIAKKFDGPSICMQGQGLTDIHWSYTKMRCE